MMRTVCGLAVCLLPATSTIAQVRPVGDGFASEGPDHRVGFDRHAAWLATAANGGEAVLRLRLAWHRRDGAPRAAVADAAPRRTHEGVRYRHGQVTERYRTTARGFEQSFVFARRPAGSGDLVLGVRATGNVTAPPTATRAHRPLYFRRLDRPTIRYGEAIAFDRAGRRVDVATEFDGDGLITLTVPAAFVDSATWPLVVDPTVGPVLNPGGASAQDSSPAVASNIDGTRNLVVWQRDTTTGSSIYGQVLDEHGNAVAPAIPYVSNSAVRDPAVACTTGVGNDRFLVVWAHQQGLRGRLVDGASGLPLAANFDITTAPPFRADLRPTVAGSRLPIATVAWQRGPASTGLGNQIMVRAIHWPTPGTPALELLGPEVEVENVTSGHVVRPRLAPSGLKHLIPTQEVIMNRLIWERFYASPAPGDYDLRTSSFAIQPPMLAVLWLNPASVPGASSILVDEFHGDIAVVAKPGSVIDDEQHLIVWEEDGDIYGHAYDRAQPVGGPFAIRATASFEGFPAVGAGACEFTVAYAESTPPNEFDVDIYAARVLRDGVVASDHRLVDDPGGQFLNGPRASSRPVHDVDEHRHNRSLLTWSGATGPASGPGDVRARYFETVLPSLAPFGSACLGPLGELPRIGTAGGEPEAGNVDFELTVDDAPTSSLAALLVSDLLTTTPVPGTSGCQLYAGLPLLIAYPALTDQAGRAAVPLPMPCSLPAGTTLAFQWAVFTPGHNAIGWITSDDLDVSWTH